MAEYGVVATGFNKKDYNTVVAERQAAMEAAFGQDINTGAESPEGAMIEQIATVVTELWNVAEQTYNAFSPSASSGVILRNLGVLSGITLEEAQASTVLVTFTGLAGSTIPAGTSISTNPTLTNGITYTFLTNVEALMTSTTVVVLATCTELGAILVGANTVTVIDTPIVDIVSVDNAAISNVGSDEETDPEFRSRREVLVAAPAVSTTDAIAAGIQSIETVNFVTVYENEESGAISIGGVPIDAHSIKAIVQGSESTAEKALIAQTIYDRKNPGFPSTGAESLVVTDTQGFPHTIKWDTPTLVPIYIDIVTEATVSTLPSDGASIKDAIVAYQNDAVTGAVIGQDVSYARLFTPVNSVGGHNVQTMKIGKTASPTQSFDIDITGAELASFNIVDINVTVNYV